MIHDNSILSLFSITHSRSLYVDLCLSEKFFGAMNSHLTRDVIYDGTRNIMDKINETYL